MRKIIIFLSCVAMMIVVTIKQSSLNTTLIPVLLVFLMIYAITLFWQVNGKRSYQEKASIGILMGSALLFMGTIGSIETSVEPIKKSTPILLFAVAALIVAVLFLPDDYEKNDRRDSYDR